MRRDAGERCSVSGRSLWADRNDVRHATGRVLTRLTEKLADAGAECALFDEDEDWREDARFRRYIALLNARFLVRDLFDVPKGGAA